MRSSVATISKSNIKHNLNLIRSFAPRSSIMAIVKANAYGHGILEISSLLRDEGVEFLGIAFPEEAIMLRNAGDTGNIVVLVPPLPEEAEVFCKYNLQPAISSFDFLAALSNCAMKCDTIVKCHLYIDTGMSRDGIFPEQALSFLKDAKSLPNIDFIGICTHFASSSSNLEFARRQLNIFNELLDELKSSGYIFQYIHASNSGAVANVSEAHFNLIRPGISLYGYPPMKEVKSKLPVKPILTLSTKIALSRRINEGDSVGYDRLYIAEKSKNIATIPIGYGDGYFKTLTGKAQCLINGKRYNIVGSVCMDECMVDTGEDLFNSGEEVILIGEQGSESIYADEIAEEIGSISYEVLTAISARIPRVYIDE